VANAYPLSSCTCTISKPPKCLSLVTTIPTLPMLFPDVVKITLPVSNLTKSKIVPVAISTLIVSWTSMSGCGNLIVLPSCVTIYGTLFGPTSLLLTLHNLNLASSLETDLTTNLPLTSYNILKCSLVFSMEITS